MEQYYPKVFEKPIYPITKNCILYSIYFIDEKIVRLKRTLYPLIEPKL